MIFDIRSELVSLCMSVLIASKISYYKKIASWTVVPLLVAVKCYFADKVWLIKSKCCILLNDITNGKH